MRLMQLQTVRSLLNNDRNRDILFKNQMRLFEMQSVKSPLNNDRYRDLLFKNQMRLADTQMKMMDMRMKLLDQQLRNNILSNNRYGDVLYKNQMRQMDMQRQLMDTRIQIMERQSHLTEMSQSTTNNNPVSRIIIEKRFLDRSINSIKNSTVDVPSILRKYYKTVKDVSPFLDATLFGFKYRHYSWAEHAKTGLDFVRLSGALAQDYYEQRTPNSLSSNTVGTGIQILVNKLLPGAGDITKSYLSLFTRYNERGATLTVDEINGWVYGVNKMTWAIVGLMRTGGNVEAMKAYATTADITARMVGIGTYSHFEKAYFFLSGTRNQLFEQNKLQNELKFRNQLYRINITPNWLFRNNMDYYWRFQKNKWIH